MQHLTRNAVFKLNRYRWRNAEQGIFRKPCPWLHCMFDLCMAVLQHARNIITPIACQGNSSHLVAHLCRLSLGRARTRSHTLLRLSLGTSSSFHLRLQWTSAPGMQNALDGSQLTVRLVVKQLCQLSLGGPAVGLAFGIVMVFWLRYIYNHDVVEVTMTIVAALGSFFVGNEILGVSGVLAVLSLGFWMVAFGEHHISRQVKNPLNVVWWVIFPLDWASGIGCRDCLCSSHKTVQLS